MRIAGAWENITSADCQWFNSFCKSVFSKSFSPFNYEVNEQHFNGVKTFEVMFNKTQYKIVFYE